MNELEMIDVNFKVPKEFADVVDYLADVIDDFFSGAGAGAILDNMPELLEAFRGYDDALKALKGEHVKEARAYAFLKIGLKKK